MYTKNLSLDFIQTSHTLNVLVVVQIFTLQMAINWKKGVKGASKYDNYEYSLLRGPTGPLARSGYPGQDASFLPASFFENFEIFFYFMKIL